jgi:ribosome-associated translation inhibitor RaiA
VAQTDVMLSLSKHDNNISIMIAGQTAMAMEGEKKQEMFEKARDVKVQGLKERIAIDQGELSCAQAAKNHDEMKACADKAKDAMEDLIRKQKERWEALKEQ